VKRRRFRQKKPKIRLLVVAMPVVVIGVIYCLFERTQAEAFFSASTSGGSSAKGAAEAATGSEKTVCLDPGHGGDADPGAVNGNVVERDINLVVANRVKTLLEIAGYKVVMTRTSNDESLDNTARADYCNANSADIMLSIHHNDFTDKVTDYATALYYKASDQVLAQDILDAASSRLGTLNDGLSTLEDNVLVKSSMPAALSEAFFVSSDDEKAQIEQSGSTRLDDEANALVVGIENYFAGK
jgi:N-acetylmuramoyl-L-alanine amidase